jgi:hypothetical protein
LLSEDGEMLWQEAEGRIHAGGNRLR